MSILSTSLVTFGMGLALGLIPGLNDAAYLLRRLDREGYLFLGAAGLAVTCIAVGFGMSTGGRA